MDSAAWQLNRHAVHSPSLDEERARVGEQMRHREQMCTKPAICSLRNSGYCASVRSSSGLFALSAAKLNVYESRCPASAPCGIGDSNSGLPLARDARA